MFKNIRAVMARNGKTIKENIILPFTISKRHFGETRFAMWRI